MEELEINNRYVDFGVELSMRVSLIHQNHFENLKDKSEKTDGTVVTRADEKTDELARERISAKFPTHQILTEEGEIVNESSRMKWIVDPIDGTTNFAHQSEDFRFMIALVDKGTPIMGIIYNTLNHNFLYSFQGEGSYLYKNGENYKLRDNMERNDVVKILGVEAPDTTDIMNTISAMEGRYFKKINCCAGKTFFDLAEKKVNLQIMKNLGIWDFAPIYAISKEAGFETRNFKGEKGWSKIIKSKTYISGRNSNLIQRFLENYRKA